MWEIYDALIDGITSDEVIEEAGVGQVWTYVQTASRFGIAMTTHAETRPRCFAGEYRGLTLRQAAKLVKSWNFIEAGIGMAAINAFYNTHDRVTAFHALQPGEQYCTAGMDLRGKKVGMIGHLRMSGDPLADAAEVRILERNPKEYDYPDSACEYLLEDCDVVLITGSSFINKTTPRLLQICKNAKTVLTGPSVPLAPELFRFDVYRLAGLIITDRVSMKEFLTEGMHCKPYAYGERFCMENKAHL